MVDADSRERTSRLERDKSRLEDSVRQHVRTEKLLETERDLFAAVLESADAFILMLDSAGRIVQVNRAVTLATGYSDDDLQGREFIAALPEGHWATSTGARLLVAGSLTPLRDADGVLRHVIVTASDVTQSRALEDELRVLSLRDDMTGLYNRRGFGLLTEQRFKDSRRSGSTLTMIYADVDHLTFINDSFGHNAGDIALGLCGGALEATFRGSDIVARIGGDEFVVLAETDTRDLSTVALRLEQELDRRTASSGLRFRVTLTIGSAHSAPPHDLSLDDLLQQASAFTDKRKHREPPQSE